MNINISFETNNEVKEETFSSEVLYILDQIKNAALDSKNSAPINRSLKNIAGDHVGNVRVQRKAY